MLDDEAWHTLEEVQQKTRLNRYQMQRLIDFLKEYGFITVDEVKRRIKLDVAVQKLMRQTSTS